MHVVHFQCISICSISISLSKSPPNTSSSSSFIPSSPSRKCDGDVAVISSGSSPTSLTLSVAFCRPSKLSSSSSDVELTQCEEEYSASWSLTPSLPVENERFFVNRNESLCDTSTSYTSNTHCILNSESVVSALLCLSLCLSLFCCVCACTCLPSWPIKIHITTHQYQCHPLHSAEIYYLCFSHLPANGLFELNGIIIIMICTNLLC